MFVTMMVLSLFKELMIQPEVVANRLKNYHQQTEPLVDYYKKNGTVYDLRSDRDPDVVKNDIFDLLGSPA